MAEIDLGFTTSGESVYGDADGGWKEAIEIYSREFVLFFFPKIYTEVDMERGYQFLDKELERVVRDAKIGKRVADKIRRAFNHDHGRTTDPGGEAGGEAGGNPGRNAAGNASR